MRCGRPLLSSLPLLTSTLPRAALLLAALGASSCINPKEMAVHARAANELGCPSSQVDVRALGGSAFVATGCGQTATYVCQRENPRDPDQRNNTFPFIDTDTEEVSCMREGEVKETGRSASFPPVLPAAGAGKQPAGVQCPAGSRWDGSRCVGEVAVTCPPGHRFEVNIGCVPGAAAAPGAATASAPAKSCPPRMAFVPGGTLPDLNGKPAAVRDLCVDLGEVTAADYGKCSSRGACSSEGLICGGAVATFAGVDRRDHPVNCVSWGQAAVYCKAEGKRLPTDAEWLWVARGGGAGTPFPWGDAAPADRVCWSGASKRDGTCAAGTPPGDTTPQRILGLAGNVSEWTASEGGASGRIVRGGSFQTVSGGGALLDGLAVEVTARSPAIGFRCVASPE